MMDNNDIGMLQKFYECGLCHEGVHKQRLKHRDIHAILGSQTIYYTFVSHLQ